MPIPKSISLLLTERERSVGELLIQAYSQNTIAAKLGVSPKTIDVHLTKMRFKCNVRNTVTLALVLTGKKQPSTDRLPMTPHQERVWELKKIGTPDKDIAIAIGIEFNTVKIHVQRIRARLGIPKHIPTSQYLREKDETERKARQHSR